jgi:acyl-CoA thioesterase-2
VPEEGIAHQEPMPEAPPPEDLPDWETQRAKLMQGVPHMTSPIEVRMADPMTNEASPPRQRSWMRVKGKLPDDPLVHTAMLVYATDRTLLSTAARPHAIPWKERLGVSLDHAVWIHHDVRLDDWLLYTSESPIAHAAHGVIFGAVWYPDGRRLASVAQEGLIRRLSR